jgi:hypothetical protein
MIHTDKYPLRQYLADEPDPELRRILHLIKHQNCPLGIPEFMDQKSIVLDLNRMGWMARVSHNDLVATLGEEAIAYNTVTKYLREAQISAGDPIPASHITSPHFGDSDGTILRATQQLPFSSVRLLSRAMH